MPVLIVVAGPTAVGKTKVAIQLAQYFQTEIISADARQFYREMNIGTAKPSAEELRTVTHHFINSLSVQEDYSVGRYEAEVLDVLKNIFAKKNVAVAVGGSGLFLRAVTDGLDALPSGEKRIRKELNLLLERGGITALQALLKEKDPEYYSVVDKKNPRRLLRALEVCLSTGKPFSSFHTKSQGVSANAAMTLREQQLSVPAELYEGNAVELPSQNQPRRTLQREFVTLKIGLHLEKEKLYERINQRVDEMMKSGLLDEARILFPLRHLNALQTVGYTELFEYFEGKINMEQAVEKIKQHTRNYAKRQMTWFKKEKDVKWSEPEKPDAIIHYLNTKINL